MKKESNTVHRKECMMAVTDKGMQTKIIAMHETIEAVGLMKEMTQLFTGKMLQEINSTSNGRICIQTQNINTKESDYYVLAKVDKKTFDKFNEK